MLKAYLEHSRYKITNNFANMQVESYFFVK